MEKTPVMLLAFVALVAIIGLSIMEGLPHGITDATGDAVIRRSRLGGNKQLKPSQPITIPSPQKSITPPVPRQQQTPVKDTSVVGTWRAYSQAIFYDNGGNNWLNRPSTRKLTIAADGTWDYGSKGTWSVQPIEQSDWKKWKIEPYGPTTKIVFNGWNNGIADGPIERNDFVWVIYHSKGFSSLGPATIQMKFGH